MYSLKQVALNRHRIAKRVEVLFRMMLNDHSPAAFLCDYE